MYRRVNNLMKKRNNQKPHRLKPDCTNNHLSHAGQNRRTPETRIVGDTRYTPDCRKTGREENALRSRRHWWFVGVAVAVEDFCFFLLASTSLPGVEQLVEPDALAERIGKCPPVRVGGIPVLKCGE
jgi:hypothetical protein